MLNKGGRKFAAVIAVFALAQGNLIAGLVSEGTWERVVLGVALLYIGGNVAQKYIKQNGNGNHGLSIRNPQQPEPGASTPIPSGDPSESDR